MAKKTIYIVIFLWLIVFSIAQASDFEKIKIAVLDFQIQGEGFETKAMGKIVAEWLITALVKEGRFDVIERRLLEKILEEQKLVMSGIVDENNATKLGKLLGVKVIISGFVMRFQDIIEVNARIIDVENASIITAESVQSKTAIRLEELIGLMAEKIIKDFPLTGYIVDRKGSNVMIDLGRKAGVKIGMQFMVYKEGNVIKHPKTGAILTVEKIQTGMVQIKSVSNKISNAEIVQEISPNEISYGHLVAENPISGPIGHKAARLYVNTDPPGAQIRILNIKDPYYRGITLKKGKYKIEVSSNGYQTVTQWVSVNDGEEKDVTIRLGRSKSIVPQKKPEPSIPVVKPTPAATPAPKNAVEMIARQLQSDNAREILKGAQLVAKKYAQNQYLLDIVEQRLRDGHDIRSRDKYHPKAMAWLCNALGASKNTKYKEMLLAIAKDRKTNRYIRKYAKKNYKRLPRK